VGLLTKQPQSRRGCDIIRDGGEKMRLKYHMVTIEDLVPEDHMPRKVDAALDLSFVYEETAHLYSQKYGRPPIDPVIM